MEVFIMIPDRTPSVNQTSRDTLESEKCDTLALLEACQSYSASGLSIKLIRSDDSPTFRVPPEVFLSSGHGGWDHAAAVVAGAGSGGRPGFGLEIIDFGRPGLFLPWLECVDALAPGLVSRLPQVRSSGGLQVYFRCKEFGASQTLVEERFKSPAGRRDPKAAIAVRGEGDHCLVPPTTPAFYFSKRGCWSVKGCPDLCHVPVISPVERGVLLQAARALRRDL
jgi:hypothetical protein